MTVPPIGTMHGNLRKAKDYYTSLPEWVPQWLKDYIETSLWWVSKQHDNDCGVNSKVSLLRAHWRFIGGILFRSELYWILRPIFAILALPVIIYAGHGVYVPDDQ